MQIYGRRRRRRWWLCFCCWNSIILRGFTASQINCHYKKRVHSLNSVSVRAYNVQNRSNIGDNCVCDKWSSVQQPCPPQDTRPAAGEYTPPIFCCCFWSQNVYHPCRLVLSRVFHFRNYCVHYPTAIQQRSEAMAGQKDRMERNRKLERAGGGWLKRREHQWQWQSRRQTKMWNRMLWLRNLTGRTIKFPFFHPNSIHDEKLRFGGSCGQRGRRDGRGC